MDRLDNVLAYETEVTGSIEMSGAEQTLVEKTDDKIGLLDGYVDFTPVVADDTVTIREYMKIKTGGEYVKYAEVEYAGVQTVPLLHLVTKPSKTSIKVSAEQTATGSGGYKTLDTQFFRRLQA